MQKQLIDQAMAEVNQILEKYNLAGVVTLHTPGTVRILSRLDPAYSCVKIEMNGRMSFKADLQRDFGGNKEAMAERVLHTAEMLDALARNTAQMLIPIAQLHKNVSALLTTEEAAGDPKEAVIKSINNS
jgi:hypothetical protein